MSSDDRPVDDQGPFVEEAVAVTGTVLEEHGRFVVYLDVVLASGAVRRRVGDWPDRRRADLAVRAIVANAARHIEPPARPD